MGSKYCTCRWATLAAVLGLAQACAHAATAGDLKSAMTESFAGGKATLDWKPYPPFGDGTVGALPADDAPDGDGCVGVLKHPGDGAATISYADVVKAEDTFEIEASIFCPLNGDDRTGALTGIAFYLPTGKNEAAAEDQGFYRLVCDYRFGDAGISLAYVGANIDRKPLEMEYWPLESTAFGGDELAGWSRVKVSVELGAIDIFLGADKLTEQPLAAERVVADIANVDAG